MTFTYLPILTEHKKRVPNSSYFTDFRKHFSSKLTSLFNSRTVFKQHAIVHITNSNIFSWTFCSFPDYNQLICRFREIHLFLYTRSSFKRVIIFAKKVIVKVKQVKGITGRRATCIYLPVLFLFFGRSVRLPAVTVAFLNNRLLPERRKKVVQ